MNQTIKSLMLAVLAVGVQINLPVHAADEQKEELVRMLRQNGSQREALAVNELITLKLSPQWWAYFLNKDTKAYLMVRDLADSLMTFGHNMGGDDIESLDQSQDASSPLVSAAISRLQPKAHITLELTEEVKPGSREQIIDNFATFGAPIGEKYYCNPRGGKLNVTISLDSKAPALRSSVSKDGNDYRFSVPAYMNVTTSPVEEALKTGT